MFGKKGLKDRIDWLEYRVRDLNSVNKSLQWQIINPPKYNVGNKHCCHGECVSIVAVQTPIIVPYGPTEYSHHWEYTFKNDGQTIVVK